MDPRGPEIALNSQKGIYPGYSIARIKSLAPHPRIPIQGDKKYAKIDNISGHMTRNEIKMETAEFSKIFIAQSWQKIHQWLEQNPSGLAIGSSGRLTPTLESEFTAVSRGADAEKIISLINQYTSEIFISAVASWKEEQERKLKNISLLSPDDRKMTEAYARYKKVLSFGQSNVSQGEGEPIEDVDKHILGGISTARMVISNFLRILPEVYTREYGRAPSKQEMKKLVQSALPLILSIAQLDVNTFGAVIHSISPKMDTAALLSNRSHYFNPNVFMVIREKDKLSLEVRPECLDEIEDLIKDYENTAIHTGCPALFVKGQDGKNVISEFYNWISKLYEKFYIDANPEFK